MLRILSPYYNPSPESPSIIKRINIKKEHILNVTTSFYKINKEQNLKNKKKTPNQSMNLIFSSLKTN